MLRTTDRGYEKLLSGIALFFPPHRAAGRRYFIHIKVYFSRDISGYFVLLFVRSVNKVNSVRGGGGNRGRERASEVWGGWGVSQLGSLPTAPPAVYILKRRHEISEQSSHHAPRPPGPIIRFSSLAAQLSISSRFSKQSTRSLHAGTWARCLCVAAAAAAFSNAAINRCWRRNKWRGETQWLFIFPFRVLIETFGAARFPTGLAVTPVTCDQYS